MSGYEIFFLWWFGQALAVGAITSGLWRARPKLRWLLTAPLLLGGLLLRAELPVWMGQPEAQRLDYARERWRRRLAERNRRRAEELLRDGHERRRRA